MAPIHTLIIEDEQDIALNVAEYLEPRGHVLDFAVTGEQGLEMALAAPYDLIILDIMLPRMDGYRVAQAIREQCVRQVPILMLTARETSDEKVTGFLSGADDYLTKPFSLAELEMRCLALTRRHQLHRDHVIKLGELTVDRKAKTVTRAGQAIPLKNIGYRIIEVLAMAHPAVVSRAELVQKVWSDDPTDSDALRSHIYQIRSLLDKPFDTPMLKTAHGVGFALLVDEGGAG